MDNGSATPLAVSESPNAKPLPEIVSNRSPPPACTADGDKPDTVNWGGKAEVPVKFVRNNKSAVEVLKAKPLLPQRKTSGTPTDSNIEIAPCSWPDTRSKASMT